VKNVFRSVLVLLVLALMVGPVAAQDVAVPVFGDVDASVVLAVAMASAVLNAVFILIIAALILGYPLVVRHLAGMVSVQHVTNMTDFWHKQIAEDRVKWNDVFLPALKALPDLWQQVRDKMGVDEPVDSKVERKPADADTVIAEQRVGG